MSLLDDLNLGLRLEDSVYRRELADLQQELAATAVRLHRRRQSVIFVFEGKDAAGKGGAIRRLTGGLLPELYRVVPVSAPTSAELAHHYLWRFWQKIPEPGRIAIFDRSWYGRVLVERVEGFAKEDEWRRAYREINETERNWANNNIAIAKFWLEIDQAEQKRRFDERANSPLTQWKLTPDDYRNREKWPLYKAAVEDMLRETTTDWAPWHLVEANDKRYARVKVLQLCLETMRGM